MSEWFLVLCCALLRCADVLSWLVLCCTAFAENGNISDSVCSVTSNHHNNMKETNITFINANLRNNNNNDGE